MSDKNYVSHFHIGSTHRYEILSYKQAVSTFQASITDIKCNHVLLQNTFIQNVCGLKRLHFSSRDTPYPSA